MGCINILGTSYEQVENDAYNYLKTIRILLIGGKWFSLAIFLVPNVWDQMKAFFNHFCFFNDINDVSSRDANHCIYTRMYNFRQRFCFVNISGFLLTKKNAPIFQKESILKVAVIECNTINKDNVFECLQSPNVPSFGESQDNIVSNGTPTWQSCEMWIMCGGFM